MEETTKKLRKLKRVADGSVAKQAGVCAGIAYCLGVPDWFIRVCFVLSVLCLGVGILPYIVLWLCMPVWEETPEDYHEVTND